MSLPASESAQSAGDCFSCFLCDTTTLTASEMEHHVRLFHSETAAGLKQSRYSCVFCEFDAQYARDLEIHIKEDHPDTYVCPVCKLALMTTEDVERHVAESHAEGDECGEETDNAFSKETTRCEEVKAADTNGDQDQLDQSVHETEYNLPKHSESSKEQKESSSMCDFAVCGKAVESLGTSLRLNDCPEDSTDQYNESDEMDGVLDSYCEDMDTYREPATVDGTASDEDSNLSVILGSMPNETPAAENDRTDSAVKPAEEHQGGAKPKSKPNKPASSSNNFGQAPEHSSPETNRNDFKGAYSMDVKRLEDSSDVDGEKIYNCPLCSFWTSSEGKIQHHVNQEHMMEEDDMSTDLDASVLVQYSCPFCISGFDTPSDLSVHINSQHPDGEVGGGSSHTWSDTAGAWASPSHSTEARRQQEVDMECPVCGVVLKGGDEAVLSAHVNGHFAAPSTTAQGQAERDHQMAMKLQSQEHKQQEEENKKFQKLQAQFGMDNTMTAKQQFDHNLERAVSKGKITAREFNQMKVVQAQSNRSGVDDGSTQVPGVLEKLQRFYDSKGCPRTVTQVHLCNSTHHYSSSYGDKGWGCGYRNFQMMLSCLMNDPSYFQLLFNGQAKMPSIQKLQQLIESAWQKGFDPQGCAQLGSRVVNTRKWIGATEIVATLSALRAKCQVLDFVKPSGPDNTHPVMIQWVRDYFKAASRFKPPLYLQHQGHSRTIVGIEELRNGNTNLLLFDPGTPRARMQQFHANINYNLLQTVRKTVNAFRAKQYQIVAVVGVVDEKELQRSKTVRSTRMS